MTIRELRRLLEDVEDTYELVLRGSGCAAPQGAPGELRSAWAAARAEATLAYEAWRACRGMAAYAIYRAAQDRADAAQDALAMAGGLPPGRGLTSQNRCHGSTRAQETPSSGT